MLGWLHADGYDIPPSTYRSHSYSTPIVGATAYLCPSWPRCRPSSLRQLPDALLVPSPGQRSRLPPAERSDFARQLFAAELRASHRQNLLLTARASRSPPIIARADPAVNQADLETSRHGRGWHPLQTASRFTPVRGGGGRRSATGREGPVKRVQTGSKRLGTYPVWPTGTATFQAHFLSRHSTGIAPTPYPSNGA